MVETCVAPSELHLKKELTALRKARFLRDPETCSSWRSPLSSKSVAVSYLNNGNGDRGNSVGENNTGRLFELYSSENRPKGVYLYNWRHHSSKLSDSRTKLDEGEKQISVEESLDDCLSNSHGVDSNQETPVRRTVKKLRSAISRRQTIKHSAVSKLLDLPSSSLGILTSVEQSDDTEYCNSEDLRQLTHDLTWKTAYHSASASPLFSGSGCGNWSYSSKILRNAKREGSSHSCTPVSTSSYYRYGGQNPSTVGSWDGTATDFDGDELDQLDLPRHQGCGIPCNWSKRAKERGCRGCYSPSLSETLRRKGSSIFCGSQTLHTKKRSSGSQKQKYFSNSSQGLPLLTNGFDACDSSIDTATDELSTNFGELDLEALSRLDGRRWSSCRSQEGLESGRPAEAELDTSDCRSLSQKYRPQSFEQIVGQNIVVQSLSNAILKGRIAPAYLFQGPRGTGKTSTARVFAAALNCLSTEANKPCGFCQDCTAFFSGNGSSLREVDATNKKDVDKVRYLLKNMPASAAVSRYKVFIIDECHLLSSKMWSAFMKFLDELPSHVVLIFITIDPDNLPRAIMSRCQRYLFSKVKDADIIRRLSNLSVEENLDIDSEALDLIAMNSDGSLRDAETMLEQLSLLGKRITTSLVNDLVGVVSDEKLLDLLEIAMSSDTAETVKRSRELMTSGVDPMALMSQLAGLIMDIIAGSYQLANSQTSVSEDELKRLQQALKILSDAEKQLRLSSERSTWFTAALLQLGSGHNIEPAESSNNSKHGVRKMNGGSFDIAKETSPSYIKSHPLLTFGESSSAVIPRATSAYSIPHDNPLLYGMPRSDTNLICDLLPTNSHSIYGNSMNGTPTDDASGKNIFRCASPEKLSMIWERCIERCHSKTLRQLLQSYGKLVLITETDGVLIAFVVFEDVNIKSRAERYLSSITNSIEIVLKRNVEVRIDLVPENHMKELKSMPDSPASNHTGKSGFLDKETKVASDGLKGNGDPKLQRKSVDCSENILQKTLQEANSTVAQDEACQVKNFSIYTTDGDDGACGSKEKGISELKTHAIAIDDRWLESAWLQAAEKNTSGLGSQSNPKENQVLPQNGISCQNQNESSTSLAISSKHWEDEVNLEIKALKVSDTQVHRNRQTGGWVDHYAISPSLLHSNGFTTNFDKENLGYESGPGCSGLFCWKTRNPHTGKVKQGTRVRVGKTSRLHCLGSMRSRRKQEVN